MSDETAPAKFVSMRYLNIAVTIQDGESNAKEKCEECMRAMRALIDEHRKLGNTQIASSKEYG